MWLEEAFLQGNYPVDSHAEALVAAFLQGERPRYLFGRNGYAEDIAQQLSVDGFIDEFTDATTHLGKPIVPLAALPADAIVVSCVVGIRPLSIKHKLDAAGVTHIDYYALQRYSGLTLKEVMFMGEAQQDIEQHLAAYAALYQRLSDDTSRHTLQALLRFRLSRNLAYMEGFTDREQWQYFEDFLNLAESGESFLDVGCYDGYTSAEFIRYCPNYTRVHLFEPDPNNMLAVRQRLADHARIVYHPYGASDAPATLRFNSNGSASGVSADGDLEIQVQRIDDVIDEPFTFLKMDIEGGELPALRGATESIRRYHPRLAISVYHKADDLWTIPQLILSIRDDYDLYLRHYTEGVTETVLFCMPRQG